MRLLVVLPCLNEAESLPRLLTAIPRAIPGVREVDVLVVDDGSTDGSGELARQHGAAVVRHPANLGLGAAFQTGIRKALERQADIMVWMDADGQFDPAHICTLIEPVLAGQADMASASRFKDPALVPDMPRVRLVGNRWMSRLISLLAGRRFHDVSCGFRAFSQEALLRLNLHGGFTYTQETFLQLHFQQLSIVEVPLAVRYFPGRRSRMASNIPAYAWRTLSIILACMRDYFPVRFYGALSILFLATGAALLAVLLAYDLEGAPPIFAVWAGVAGAMAAVTGAALLATAFAAHMLGRLRVNQERLLYIAKREVMLRGASGEPAAPAGTEGDAAVADALRQHAR